MDLFHFSHDPTMQRFVPHIPASNPAEAPAVWAIDAAHAPLYWFPRACPRVTVWPRTDPERDAYQQTFCTTAPRVHAIELTWLPAMSTTVLYRYRLNSAAFQPWSSASGQWISRETVEPLGVEPMGDLVRLHIDAEIELRAVPSLWPINELARRGPWDFSIVRLSHANPRPVPPSTPGHSQQIADPSE